jgi:hypothetical protein
MSAFSDVRKKLEEQKGGGGGGPTMRTDYHCAAHGCPNAASIDDDMERGGPRGKCFFHWRADPKDWPAVTEWIKADFEKRRNWDENSWAPGMEVR